VTFNAPIAPGVYSTDPWRIYYDYRLYVPAACSQDDAYSLLLEDLSNDDEDEGPDRLVYSAEPPTITGVDLQPVAPFTHPFD
jgi:hypothetical protein